MWSVFDVSPPSLPPSRVNARDQTLSPARVTLSASCPRGQGKARSPPRRQDPRAWPGRDGGALPWPGVPEVKRALFNGLPVFKLRCRFFLYGKKRKEKKIVPFNLFAQTQKTYSI